MADTKIYDIANSGKISQLLGASSGAPSTTLAKDKKTKPKKKEEPVWSLPPSWDERGTSLPKQAAGGWGKPSAVFTAPRSFDMDLTQPGIGEQTVSQLLPGLLGPTNAQGFVDQGSFNTPTASEGYYAQNAGHYQTPGAAETWWAQNQGQFNTPGAAEEFYEQHKGRLDSMPDPTNRAEEEYQAQKSRRPDIASDPGLDPYYDEAVARGTRSLNKRSAALGAYGSSVALGEVGNLISGLEAEKANREADYNLRRIAEQRQWEELGGRMASAADSSSLGISQNELSQLLGFSGMAQNAQQSELSRLLGAAGASQGAQGAQTSRLNAGASAAGQATQGDLGRQNLALSAALGADSQNRGNAVAAGDLAMGSQGAREGRIGGAFDRQSQTLRDALEIITQSQNQGVNMATEFQAAEQALTLAERQDLRAQAAQYAQMMGQPNMTDQLYQGLVIAIAGGLVKGAFAGG